MDQHTFTAQIIRPHTAGLLTYARRLTRCDADASDLVQDTLTRAWSYRDTLLAGANVGAWLRTIMRNAFVSGERRATVRRDAAEKVARERLGLGTGPAVDAEHAIAQTDAANVLERLASGHEVEVDGKVYRMESATRAAVWRLVEVEGLSYQQAAKVLGCPVGTIMSRLHRARMEIREPAKPVQLGLALEEVAA